LKKIESFTVDHLRLKLGVYVSRIDSIGAETVTTFDLRMKLANKDRLDNGAIHTLEHLIATYVRNDEEFASRILYFGPTFTFAADYEGEIPGVSAIECGNYELHNLEGAKLEAAAYLEVLNHAGPENLNYPE